jgi:hypothetical protein
VHFESGVRDPVQRPARRSHKQNTVAAGTKPNAEFEGNLLSPAPAVGRAEHLSYDESAI